MHGRGCVNHNHFQHPLEFSGEATGRGQHVEGMGDKVAGRRPLEVMDVFIAAVGHGYTCLPTPANAMVSLCSVYGTLM